MTTETDVIVVGAGLSGLAAARLLVDKGVDCVVLEARDRVGGRTSLAKVGDATIDVGGQWLGARHQRLSELAAELGLETFPTHHRGRKILDLAGKVSSHRGTIPTLSPWSLFWLHRALTKQDALRREVPLDAPWEAGHAPEWDAMTVDAFKAQLYMPGAVSTLFDVAVRTVMGAEPAELSLLYFLFYMNSNGGLRRVIEIEDGAQERRFIDGAGAIAQRLSQSLDASVVLSAPVRQVRQEPDRVVVRSDLGEFRARYAILATPPAAALDIDFAPALPAQRLALLKSMRMGHTAKAFVFYKTPFWRAAGFSGEAVCSDGPVTFFVDNTDHEERFPCLLGFMVGAPGRRARTMAPDERRAAITAQLVRYFGPAAADVSQFHEHDWADEPWTHGCPVASIDGPALTRHGAALREPFGRVHWAGTETAVDFCGYMEGALEAGERAADEVLAAL